MSRAFAAWSALAQDAPAGTAEGAAAKDVAVAEASGAPTPDVTDPAIFGPIAGLALLVGLAFVPLVRGVARWAYPRPASSTGRSFELRDIAAVALVFVGLQLVAGTVVQLFDLDPEGLFVALNLTVALQAATGAAVLVLATRRPHGFAALGLRPKETGWATVYGLVRYLGSLPFLFALMAATPFLLERVFGLPHDTQEVARMIAAAEGRDRLVVPIYAAFLIPLLEELLFRGFLQNTLEPRVGPLPAVLLTSAAFAALPPKIN